MICPKCKTEYRPGFVECSDCRVELVPCIEHATETTVHRESEFRTILETENPVLISAATALLEEAELEFYVQNEAQFDMFGGRFGPSNTVFQSAAITVPKEQVSQARQLLDHLQEKDSDLLCSGCGATVTTDDETCSSCGESFED